MIRFKQSGAVLALASLLCTLTACHDAPEYRDDPFGNFDALCDAVDQHYCFFAEKDIDWDGVRSVYRSRITPQTGQYELFGLCAQMLDTLRDGHVNLASRFNTSYYRRWWTDYPQDFSLRTLQQYYLDFDWNTVSGLMYKKLPDDVGYIYYPSFSSGISETSLDYALAALHECRALILDIRDNGGGLLTNIDVLMGRFITRDTPGGYIRHKTGPGHDDFSEPYEITYKPSSGRVQWLGQLYVLTNRSCFSSANDFVAAIKGLDGVTVIGARTGGGGGLPFSSELPCGWSVRFSACPISDRNDRCTEFGIDPDQGYEVHAPEEELARGHDAILDRALSLARNIPDPGKAASPRR